MKNKNIESNQELPSMAKLIKSTILAIGIAAIILISVVLPAEYGIDPTGIGGFIGLVKMGQIKVSLSEEATADRESANANTTVSNEIVKPVAQPEAEKVVENSNSSVNTDKITITLKPNEGKEIKLAMLKDANVDFVWYTDGGKANFDTHADSKKLKINYHNYEKGSMERNEGTMVAAFDGNHGWFWRNRTPKTMTVTLEVNGDFSEVFQY